jgi:hypothetical protein
MPLSFSFVRSALRLACGRLAFSTVAFLFSAFLIRADGPLPLVVAGPPSGDDGSQLRELFDQPDSWKESRAQINAFLTNDHMWGKVPDGDVQKWMGQLKQWHLPLELEVGAVKEWGGQTGQSTFEAERPGWDRLISLGAPLKSIAQDEPLCCVRYAIKKDDDYAVNETASFISLVRQTYPQMKIGDIEPYPSLKLEEHQKWLDALQAKLASMNVKGLDFYRVDVDWNSFNVAGDGNWKDVKGIADYCKKINVPFSLIYWSSYYPFLKSKNIGSDNTWYVGIMSEGYAYAAMQAAPNQYCIESWVGAPSRNTPDSTDFTFMNSVKDFTAQFVRQFGP